MTFYQELQLNSAGSKQLIRAARTKRAFPPYFNLLISRYIWWWRSVLGGGDSF